MACGEDRLETERVADAFVSQCHCRMRAADQPRSYLPSGTSI
jgi:hypothetical protein